MARDAAGRDRMHIGRKGWISFDRNPNTGEVTMTVSDGDGYSLPQIVEDISPEDQRLIKLYMAQGYNVKENPMGPEVDGGDGWTYILEGVDTEAADYRYRPDPMLDGQIQAEVWVGGDGDEWASFGIFENKDKMYGEIELSRAEPRPD